MTFGYHSEARVRNRMTARTASTIKSNSTIGSAINAKGSESRMIRRRMKGMIRRRMKGMTRERKKKAPD